MHTVTRVSHTLYTSTEYDILRSIYSGVNKNTEYGASRVPDFSDRVEKEDDRHYPEKIQIGPLLETRGRGKKGQRLLSNIPARRRWSQFASSPQADMIDS